MIYSSRQNKVVLGYEWAPKKKFDKRKHLSILTQQVG